MTRKEIAPLFAPAVARLGKAADSAIAKQCGVSTYRIREERRRRGIAAFVGSGPDPELGPGIVRSVVKTIRLSPGEEKDQIAAAQAAGAKDWGTWIRGLGNAAAMAYQGAGHVDYRADDLITAEERR